VTSETPKALSEEDELADELASAPESGQVLGGRDNPWDDDDEDEPPGPVHAFPADHHAPPGDDL
jgi:hypothetical protein